MAADLVLLRVNNHDRAGKLGCSGEGGDFDATLIALPELFEVVGGGEGGGATSLSLGRLPSSSLSATNFPAISFILFSEFHFCCCKFNNGSGWKLVFQMVS